MFEWASSLKGWISRTSVSPSPRTSLRSRLTRTACRIESSCLGSRTHSCKIQWLLQNTSYSWRRNGDPQDPVNQSVYSWCMSNRATVATSRAWSDSSPSSLHTVVQKTTGYRTDICQPWWRSNPNSFLTVLGCYHPWTPFPGRDISGVFLPTSIDMAAQFWIERHVSPCWCLCSSMGEGRRRSHSGRDATTKTAKDKIKAAENRAAAAEKAWALTEKWLAELTTRQNKTDLKLAEAVSLNVALNEELTDLRDALEACENKWYDKGFTDAEEGVEPVIREARQLSFQEGWMAALHALGVPEDSHLRDPS